MAAPYSPHDTTVRQPSMHPPWDGVGEHPGMTVSAASSMQLKELSIDRAISIFVEYLTYDAKNVQQMYSFVAQYPWVLTDPQVCESIVGDPNCFNTLRQTAWWDQAVANAPAPTPETLPLLWLRKNHALALAYAATDSQLESVVDWPAWETLLQEHGPVYQPHERDPDMFYRTRAFVVLANRLGTDMAPLMCAAMGVLLPMDDLEKTVGDQWTPLQKAQFGWIMEKSHFVGDAWPASSPTKECLRQAQEDVLQWKALVPASELSGLDVVYDLNNNDLEKTISELMEMRHFAPSTESLDYTMALENETNPNPL